MLPLPGRSYAELEAARPPLTVLQFRRGSQAVLFQEFCQAEGAPLRHCGGPGLGLQKTAVRWVPSRA